MQQVISWNDLFFFCFIKSLLLGSCRATASSGTQDQANGPPNTGPHQLVPLPPSIFYLLSVYHLYPCPNILLLYGKIKGSHSNHCCYFYLHKVSWTKQDSKADSFETVQDKTFFFFFDRSPHCTLSFGMHYEFMVPAEDFLWMDMLQKSVRVKQIFE